MYFLNIQYKILIWVVMDSSRFFVLHWSISNNKSFSFNFSEPIYVLSSAEKIYRIHLTAWIGKSNSWESLFQIDARIVAQVKVSKNFVHFQYFCLFGTQLFVLEEKVTLVSIFNKPYQTERFQYFLNSQKSDGRGRVQTTWTNEGGGFLRWPQHLITAI